MRVAAGTVVGEEGSGGGQLGVQSCVWVAGEVPQDDAFGWRAGLRERV